MLIRKSPDIQPSEITDSSLYANRWRIGNETPQPGDSTSGSGSWRGRCIVSLWTV